MATISDLQRQIVFGGFALLLVAPLVRRDGKTPDDDRIAESVRAVFPETVGLEQCTIRLSAEERETLHARRGLPRESDSLRVFVATGRDSLLGYAVVGNVRGKDQLITFLLIVTPDLTVRELEILAYRESFGGEVRNASWRNQFRGKGPRDPLQPGRDISSITGATISARAVTLGVKNALEFLETVKANLPRPDHRPR